MRKIRSICLLFSVLASFSAIAQTKLIAHKSHSGSNGEFRIAYSADHVELGNSNFGRGPEPLVRTASLDSLIFLSDTVAVMVTSEVCKNPDYPRRASTKWRSGKDTVYNHPLFTKLHSVSYIKSFLQ